jgi:hypothetical protein
MLNSPAKLISLLAYACGGLTALYLVLMATTVFFAAWQTELAHQVREMEGDIGALEASYYETIGKLNDMDPYAIGFVSPRVVGYVVETTDTGLTRAD